MRTKGPTNLHLLRSIESAFEIDKARPPVDMTHEMRVHLGRVMHSYREPDPTELLFGMYQHTLTQLKRSGYPHNRDSFVPVVERQWMDEGVLELKPTVPSFIVPDPDPMVLLAKKALKHCPDISV